MTDAERIADVLRIKVYARAVFESSELAAIWFSAPNPALEHRVPMDLLRSAPGRRAVEIILRRIDYGDYS